MKHKRFLGSKPAQLSIFFICLFLLIWPFLATPSVAQPKAMFLYLFSAWGFILFIAFFISRVCWNEAKPKKARSRRAD